MGGLIIMSRVSWSRTRVKWVSADIVGDYLPITHTY